MHNCMCFYSTIIPVTEKVDVYIRIHRSAQCDRRGCSGDVSMDLRSRREARSSRAALWKETDNIRRLTETRHVSEKQLFRRLTAEHTHVSWPS